MVAFKCNITQVLSLDILFGEGLQNNIFDGVK